MTSQQIFAAIDGFISAFMAFAKATLAPIAILIAFFGAVKAVTILIPFIGQFVPSFLNKGVTLEMVGIGILCALASGK